MNDKDSGVLESTMQLESKSSKGDRRKEVRMEWVKAVGMPLVTIVLGFVFNASRNSRQASENASLSLRQARENTMRFNAEMMGKQIEADSALRKDMLLSIIQSFGRPSYEGGSPAQQLEAQILNLEVIATNFQDSL